MVISTSILTIPNDVKKIQKIDQSKTDYIHLDVMDGKFVPNEVSFLDLPPLQKKIDIHFMTYHVKEYVDAYLRFKPEYITFHLEATQNVKEMIDYIKAKNIKVGISIKPKTSILEIIPYLDFLDLVLIMTVEPGFGGQDFIEDTVQKIDELSLYKEKYSFQIEVDGGINEETLQKCKNADIFVVGSYITSDENPNEKIERLKKL